MAQLLICGASLLTIDAGGKSRIFFVNGRTAISGLTLTGGDGIGTTNTFYNREGGAILNIGNLTLSDDVIRGNAAAFGGGIYNISFLSSTDDTFSNNLALDAGLGAEGGGMVNQGIMTSMDDTISGNSAQSTFNDTEGGAIWNGSDLS
ncbi:MAG: hypothetical protein ACREHD_02565, partial [Pirellulales bacterium]